MNALKNNRGAALVYTSLFSVVMLLFIGLAIDLGWIVYAKNLAQRSVDAAALSGTAGIQKYNLDGSTDQIEARTTAFNNANTVLNQAGGIIGKVNTNGDTDVVIHNSFDDSIAAAPPTSRVVNGIRVTKVYDIPLPFRGLFSGGVSTVTVSATAVLRYKGTLPILFYCSPAAYPGTCPTSGTYPFLASDDPARKVAYTTWFQTDASLPDYLNQLIINPDSNPWVMRGDEIELVNSQVPGPMHEVYLKWNAEPGHRLCVFLLVVDGTNPNSGKDQERVLGMTPVIITNVVDPNNGDNQGNGPPPPETFTVEIAPTGCSGLVSANAFLVR